MKVDILFFDEKAVSPYKKYKRDFCYDCVATWREEVAPGIWKYGLGIGLQIRDEDKNRIPSIELRPRSSIWKTGMILSNSPGTIDEPYTGELMAVFYHVMKDMPIYEVGDRVCQIRLSFTEEVEFNVVKSFEKTERGSGGYGSTGLSYNCEDKILDIFYNEFPQFLNVADIWNIDFEQVASRFNICCFISRIEKEFRLKFSVSEIKNIQNLKQLKETILNKKK